MKDSVIRVRLVKQAGRAAVEGRSRPSVLSRRLLSVPIQWFVHIDQLSRHWIPADYVNELHISFDNDAVISFTLSRLFTPPRALAKLAAGLEWLNEAVVNAHAQNMSRAEIQQLNLIPKLGKKGA